MWLMIEMLSGSQTSVALEKTGDLVFRLLVLGTLSVMWDLSSLTRD